ncbi:L,D-transpeptidase family protein [Undibacterium sp. Ji22W]|uniref:L,D-transpeptidase family protein n=1 Tax=Undibacterium sp. Ji22W TaxID=3413038 RepID=UPI003BF1C8B5
MGWTFSRLLMALISFTLLLTSLSACTSMTKSETNAKAQQQVLLVSVPEQKMLFIENGQERETFLISTAKKGIGDVPDSYMTPAGTMEIAEKFGDNLALGSVLKDRVATGEVVPVEAPGRDPIVTRVLWLRGLEERNRNAYPRFIYIHGTPQESLLGTAASFGCIRMRSVDIVKLYDAISLGAKVVVSEAPLEPLKAQWKLATMSASVNE